MIVDDDDYIQKFLSKILKKIGYEIESAKSLADKDKLSISDIILQMIEHQEFIGIVLLQESRIKYANEAVSQILGYSSDEIINFSIERLYNLFHPDDRIIALERAKRLPEFASEKFEYRVITNEGKIRKVEIYSNVIEFEGKLAIITFFIDVKEKQELLEKLREIDLNIHSISESEENSRRALDQSIFYQKLIIHDINNILNSIGLTASYISLFLREPEKSAKISELIENIKDLVKVGGKTIQNINKLSNLVEFKQKTEKIDVNDILEKSTEIIIKSFPKTTIKINIELDNTKFFAQANELLLDVFGNILHNAIKHNNNSVVEILIKIFNYEKDNKNYIKLEFIDNGKGILDKKKHLLFQKGSKKDFYKSGMGIGLLLVKKIINYYGGKIWVEDRVEGDYTKGSNFIVLLPEYF